MSRSNNNNGDAGRVPPPPPVPARSAPQTQPAVARPQAGYIPPPLPPAQQGHVDPGQGYYFPQAGTQGGQYAQQPAFDAYGHPLPGGHAPPQAHGQPSHSHPQGGYAPAPAPGLSSYVPANQPTQWNHGAGGEPLQADPRGYDLGQYAAGQHYGQQDRLPPDFGQYAAEPTTQQLHAQPQGGYYPPQPPQQGYPANGLAYQPSYAEDQYGQPGQRSARQPAPVAHGYAQPQPGHGSHDQSLSADLDDDGFEDEPVEDEPRRGKRSLMVVAALVGAIGIGGGLAYGYKTFANPGTKAQLAKVEPVKKAAGGNVANPPERKITERLPDVVPQASGGAPSSDNQDLGGPRKVQLIPIAPPGAPAAVAVAPPQQQRPTISVPGVTLDNMPAPPPLRVPAAVPQPAQPPPVAAAVPVARPAPPPSAVAVAPQAVVDPAAKKVAKVPAVKSKTNDAFAPGATATASVAAPAAAKATGGNGFVAVLASQKSRMDALKVYADLQQKYGEVLSNKPADVQEANLGDKGVFYRAVVGPPGSREAATTLCTQLKTAGYTGCWVTAY